MANSIFYEDKEYARWQRDAAASAAMALHEAQATQIYAGLGLWPAAVTAALRPIATS